MLVEYERAQALADRQGLLVAMALGAEGELPDVGERIAALDERLHAEPKRLTPDRELLLRALGVRSGR